MEKYYFEFVGQIIPQKILNKNFDRLQKMVAISANTFYTSLLEGLVENDCVVSAVSRINKKNIQYGTQYNGVNYIFCQYTRNNVIRHISTFFRGIIQIIKLNLNAKRNKTKPYAVFNVLRISASLGALLACKILKVPTIGIVTDAPGHRINLKSQGRHFFVLDK